LALRIDVRSRIHLPHNIAALPLEDFFMTLNRPYRSFLVALAATLSLVGSPAWADAAKEKELLAVLKSDAPAGEKAITCKKHAIYGSGESVAELAKLLTNPELSSWARIALEAIPGPEADAALRKASETLEGRLLIGMINSIGVRRDSSSVEVLTARLHDKDRDVAAAAAVALGRIGNDSAVKALRTALASAGPETRSAMAEGCVLAAERLNASGKSVEAVAIYDEVRKAEVSKPRLIEATRGAILARKSEGLPLLIELFRSQDKDLFRLGLTVAREFPGTEIDKALAGELLQTTPERGALIVTTMADRPETVDSLAILAAAGSGKKPVRLAALSALSRIGNESAFDILLQGATDADADIAAAAKTTLAELPGQKIDSKIATLLPDAKGKTYSLLIELVGMRRIDATPALLKALTNTDKAVRRSALVALGETVDLQGLAVLITQVNAAKDADDAAVAQAALRAASVRMPDREACAGELATALPKASTESKTVLLEILSEVGGEKALKTVGAAAKSNDPVQQDVGSRVLGKWSSVDAAPVLLDLAKTGPAVQYRVRALRGYIGLARKFAMPEQDRVEMCQKAMNSATQVAEQKLVLDVLRIHPSLPGLKMAAAAVKNPELKDDATLVATTIAKKLGDKPEVKDVLSKAGIENK